LGTRAEEDFEIDTGKFLRPARLPAVEYFGCCEVLKVLVIGEYLDLMDRAFTVTSPVFERVHNCEKLIIVNLIVDFGCREFSWVEGNRV
jgi:hypothetical protein